MKKFTRILSLGLILFGLQTSQAQFLKKLKDKVNKKIDQTEQKLTNKVEQEIDKTLDGTIDGLFESNSDTPSYSETNDSTKASETKNKTYSGSVNLDHAHKYGSVQINTLDNLKIERTNDGYNFYGNWLSHEVDIFDGYKLELKTTENLELEKKYTFNIPKAASFRLGYDPLLTAEKAKDNYSKGVSDDYQNIDLNSGLVKVTINKDKSFEIEFSGQAEFVERIRTTNDDVKKSTYTASVMGNLQGKNPKFLDNKKITKNDGATASTSSVPTYNSSTNTAQAKGSYVFTYETVVQMTAPGQDRAYKLSYLLNPDTDYMGMKADMSEYSEGEMGGESIIVMDGNSSFVFVDSPGMKMQISSNMMGNQQTNPTDQMENYDYTNLTKTGNTKSILGYSCEEYVMSDNKNSLQFWVAPELKINNWYIPNKNLIDGHILEYSVDSPDGQMTITTLEIKKGINKTINPSEYKKMF